MIRKIALLSLLVAVAASGLLIPVTVYSEPIQLSPEGEQLLRLLSLVDSYSGDIEMHGFTYTTTNYGSGRYPTDEPISNLIIVDYLKITSHGTRQGNALSSDYYLELRGLDIQSGDSYRIHLGNFTYCGKITITTTEDGRDAMLTLTVPLYQLLGRPTP